jgi:hypothetical protein
MTGDFWVINPRSPVLLFLRFSGPALVSQEEASRLPSGISHISCLYKHYASDTFPARLLG